LDVAPDPDSDETLLRFPGRVLASGDRLFVADTGHHRIVVSSLEGRIERIVGEGGAGAHDGSAEHASFCNPQRLAVLSGHLYVADTGNHLLRRVDLASWVVTTVAGTGDLGRGVERIDPERPHEISLRSPWGLLAAGQQLLIAMAGSHQIWAYDP